MLICIVIKNRVQIAKWKSEAESRRTNIIRTNRKMTNGQLMVDKTLQRKHTIEQHKPHGR
jgi:hypothetical protein